MELREKSSDLFKMLTGEPIDNITEEKFNELSSVLSGNMMETIVKEVREALFYQQIEDMKTIDFIIALKSKGQLESVNIEKLEKMLADSLNPWIKELLTVTLRSEIRSLEPKSNNVYRTIHLLETDLFKQEKIGKSFPSYSEAGKEEVKLFRAYTQKSAIKQEIEQIEKKVNIY